MSYKFEKYTKENIEKYKSKDNMLRHARYSSNTDGIFVINKENDILVGYIAWENEWIIALEVIKEFRNLGIAKMLLNQALANNIKKLSVNKKNIKAYKLYLHLGWKIMYEDKIMYYMIHI